MTILTPAEERGLRGLSLDSRLPNIFYAIPQTALRELVAHMTEEALKRNLTYMREGKVEAIRLFNWSQINNTSYLKPSFTERYDPLGSTNNTMGTVYVGFVKANPPASLPAAYSSNMLEVTVTLYWTNYIGNKKLVRSRDMSTYVARYGMQNYVYGQ